MAVLDYKKKKQKPSFGQRIKTHMSLMYGPKDKENCPVHSSVTGK
jgi:hypothetical protein